MARSQPYGFACSGGLVDSANRFDLFKAPGVATTLRNFEVAVEGGYRRINGYSLFVVVVLLDLTLLIRYMDCLSMLME